MKFIITFLILPWAASGAVLYYSDHDATMFKEEKLYTTIVMAFDRGFEVLLISDHISCSVPVKNLDEAKWLKESAFTPGTWIQCHGPYTQPNNPDAIYVAAKSYSVGQHTPGAPQDRYLTPD